MNYAVVKAGEEDNKGYLSIGLKVIDDKIVVSIQVGTLYHTTSEESEKLLKWYLKKLKYKN